MNTVNRVVVCELWMVCLGANNGLTEGVVAERRHGV